MRTEVQQAVDYLRERGITDAEAGIILGTGLGKLVDHMEIDISVDYADIPHFPVSTVEFHKGRLLSGNIRNRKVLVMQGRFHYYEGYHMQQLSFGVPVMKALGIKYLLVSNACGTMNPEFRKGGLMLITDHINQFFDNPLIGPNDETEGPRFVDMSQAYSKELNEIFIRVANQLGIKLYQGIYTALSGPSLETRAEYRYLRFIGADVVGMSTIPEVIKANHLGLKVAAVSVITDECDPDHLAPINIDDILQTAALAEQDLIRLFMGVIEQLPEN